MLEMSLVVIKEFWSVLCEMSPYLLFGFLVAGLLSVMVKQETVERHLGDRTLWSVAKAALLGAPLPLCSCGVIPVAASLRQHGASRGATASFLLATPQTSVDSIMVTFSLLGPVFAIFRPVAALLSAMVGGAVILYIEHETIDEAKEEQMPACTAPCCAGDSNRGKLYQALHYGFVTLAGDIGRALLIGLFIAGIIAAFVPDNFFAGILGGGFVSKLVMMLVGLPVYVCATASVPVAAALILKGISPGAALVFLMTGPATNAAAFTTVWKIMGKKTALVYMTTVAVIALIAGTILDYLYTARGVAATPGMGWMLPEWAKIASAVILLAVLGSSMFRSGEKIPASVEKDSDGAGIESEIITRATLLVSGMTCSHCTKAVTRALGEQSGVAEVSIDLQSGEAVVSGRGFGISDLTSVVEELGYTVEVRDVSAGNEDRISDCCSGSSPGGKCSDTCCGE